MSALPTRLGGTVGTSVARLGAEAFVSGRAAFTADLLPPDCLHVRLVRSPHARAAVGAVGTAAALAIPGVIAVITGHDLLAVTDPTPSRFAKDRFPGALDVRSLAIDHVAYVGEPVAAVVAVDAGSARRGAACVDVDYAPSKPTLDPADALAGAAPVHSGWGTNCAARDLIVAGDTDAAFAAAAVVVEGTLHLDASTSAPMETRAYVAEWNSRAERLTLTGTFQMPHPARWAVAQALRLRESQVRVVAPNIGGTFGLKMVGHPEEVLVGALARMLGRPVAFIEDRAECFLARCREQRHDWAIAAGPDGRILAFRDRMMADIGAVGAGGGWQMGLVAAAVFPTVYDVPNIRIDCTLATTNKAPWQGVRGYGKEVANFVMERAVDRLADALGMDKLAVRRRNLLPPDAFPHRLPSGMLLDSGDYPAALDQLEALCAAPVWKRRRTGDQAVGIGVAFELTPEGASFPGAVPSGFETTTVRVDPSGEVVVLTSVTSPGGGNETGIAQLVGGVLGLPPGAVHVSQGDTDVSPFGNTSSRSLMFGGAAAVTAAREVAAKLAQCGAALLGVEPIDILFTDGVLMAGHAGRSIPFAAAAMAAYAQSFTIGAAVALPLQATHSYKAQNVRHVPDEGGRISAYPSFPYSAHAAAVEVCHATGVVRVLDYAVVHDCGVVVNPALVEGQIRGAVAMGIGAALWEQLRMDAAGRPVADRFKAYLLPRATDLPRIRVGHLVTPSPFHPLGMKGAASPAWAARWPQPPTRSRTRWARLRPTSIPSRRHLRAYWPRCAGHGHDRRSLCLCLSHQSGRSRPCTRQAACRGAGGRDMAGSRHGPGGAASVVRGRSPAPWPARGSDRGRRHPVGRLHHLRGPPGLCPRALVATAAGADGRGHHRRARHHRAGQDWRLRLLRQPGLRRARLSTGIGGTAATRQHRGRAGRPGRFVLLGAVPHCAATGRTVVRLRVRAPARNGRCWLPQAEAQRQLVADRDCVLLPGAAERPARQHRHWRRRAGSGRGDGHAPARRFKGL